MLSCNVIDSVLSSVMSLNATRSSESESGKLDSPEYHTLRSRVLIHPRGFACYSWVKVVRVEL